MEEHQLTSPTLPLEDPSKKDADLLFATSLNLLPMKKREEALHDIHVAADIMIEEPEFILKKLQELETEIQKKHHQNKSAYDTAKSVSNEYASNRTFRLKFLRADNYDPVKAAVRFMRHFEGKLELFGKDKLVRDI
jgi:hypothetical protein